MGCDAGSNCHFKPAGLKFYGTLEASRPYSGMARFYMHICDSNMTIEDEEGYEFADADTARAEALQSARDLMASNLREGRPLDLDRFFLVTDERGERLFVVQFRDALPPE